MKFMDILRESLPDGGDCFDSSYDFMMKHGVSNKKLKLVHGFVSGKGDLSGYRFTHGWCEDEDTVFDNANNQSYRIPKQLYYAMGNIYSDECKYYDYHKTIEFSLKYKDKGPWEIDNKSFEEVWDPKTRRYN